MNRLAGRALPHNHGLALVGDADGGHIARPRAGLAQRFYGATQLAGENLVGVVLHPALLRIELLELLLRYRGNGAGMIEENSARTGRSLIQCKNVSHR